MIFLGANLLCTDFQTRCRLRFFSPIWSDVNQNEKKIGKKKKKSKFKIPPIVIQCW